MLLRTGSVIDPCYSGQEILNCKSNHVGYHFMENLKGSKIANSTLIYHHSKVSKIFKFRNYTRIFIGYRYRYFVASFTRVYSQIRRTSNHSSVRKSFFSTEKPENIFTFATRPCRKYIFLLLSPLRIIGEQAQKQ